THLRRRLLERGVDDRLGARALGADANLVSPELLVVLDDLAADVSDGVNGPRREPDRPGHEAQHEEPDVDDLLPPRLTRLADLLGDDAVEDRSLVEAVLLRRLGDDRVELEDDIGVAIGVLADEVEVDAALERIEGEPPAELVDVVRLPDLL